MIKLEFQLCLKRGFKIILEWMDTFTYHNNLSYKTLMKMPWYFTQNFQIFISTVNGLSYNDHWYHQLCH